MSEPEGEPNVSRDSSDDDTLNKNGKEAHSSPSRRTGGVAQLFIDAAHDSPLPTPPPKAEKLPERLRQVKDACLEFLDSTATSDDETTWATLQRRNDGASDPAAPPASLEVAKQFFGLEMSQYIGPQRKRWSQRVRPSSPARASHSSSASLLENGSEVICVRGRLRFPLIEPGAILDLILKLHERPRWDSEMVTGHIALPFDMEGEQTYLAAKSKKKLSVGSDLAYLAYNGANWAGVSPRDLCLLRYWERNRELGGGPTSISTGGSGSGTACILVAESVQETAVPVRESCVRANLRECAYLMERVELSTTTGGALPRFFTDVTYVSSLDFGGTIPKALTNVVIKQQPKTLLKMRSLLAEQLAAGAAAGGEAGRYMADLGVLDACAVM